MRTCTDIFRKWKKSQHICARRTSLIEMQTVWHSTARSKAGTQLDSKPALCSMSFYG
uniref:Uncharacterized protein n=1 Tax=uncultured marine virus TaxID=186617 RepID=A0A0F7LAU0_9VIRU|nr:hypothetical protein [uncultured marine virus]